MAISELQFRDVLDEIGVMYRKLESCKYLMIISADEDFDHDIVMNIVFSEDHIAFRAYARDLEIPEERYYDALAFCNRMCLQMYGSFFIDEDRNVNAVYRIPELNYLESTEYVLECLKLILAATFRFFKNVGVELE